MSPPFDHHRTPITGGLHNIGGDQRREPVPDVRGMDGVGVKLSPSPGRRATGPARTHRTASDTIPIRDDTAESHVRLRMETVRAVLRVRFLHPERRTEISILD